MLWGSNPLEESCWKSSAKGPGSGVKGVYRMCSGQTSKASLSGEGWALLLSIWSGKGRGSQQCWGCWRRWVPKIKSCYSCADAVSEVHSPSNPVSLNTLTPTSSPFAPSLTQKHAHILCPPQLSSHKLPHHLQKYLKPKHTRAHTHTHKHIVTHTYTNTFSCLTNISYSAILKEEVSVLIKMDIDRNIYKI